MENTRQKLEKVISDKSYYFQFESKQKNNKWVYYTDEIVELFLKEYDLKGWKPFDIYGNGTDLGEMIFYNKKLNLYFGISSYEDEGFDSYSFYIKENGCLVEVINLE